MRRRRSQMENLDETAVVRVSRSTKQSLPEAILVLGATSAIAQAWMRLLAPQEASFFLVARNAAHLDSVAKDLVTRGATAVHVETADLDDTAGHVAILERAAAALGSLDCAFIAHGVLGDQAAGERNFAIASASLQTNFLSTVSLVTWLANYFAAQLHGRLVVISSVAGDRGRKSNYIYGAAKAGLNAFLDGAQPAGSRGRPGADGSSWICRHPDDGAPAAGAAVCYFRCGCARHPARHGASPGCAVHAVVLAMDHGPYSNHSRMEIQEDGLVAGSASRLPATKVF